MRVHILIQIDGQTSGIARNNHLHGRRTVILPYSSIHFFLPFLIRPSIYEDIQGAAPSIPFWGLLSLGAGMAINLDARQGPVDPAKAFPSALTSPL